MGASALLMMHFVFLCCPRVGSLSAHRTREETSNRRHGSCLIDTAPYTHTCIVLYGEQMIGYKQAGRHAQQAAITAEVEAAAAAVEAELDAQEWNMQEIERIQEEQARTDMNACSNKPVDDLTTALLTAVSPCSEQPVSVQGCAGGCS